MGEKTLKSRSISLKTAVEIAESTLKKAEKSREEYHKLNDVGSILWDECLGEGEV